MINFFRDPERVIPQVPDAVVSPADGQIIFAAKVYEDRFLNKETLKISIFMNVFNVHINRSPIKGIINNVVYKKGSFLNASLDKASEKNERSSTIITNTNGSKLVVVQIAGLIARRIVSFVSPNQNLEQGERFGLIRFGSRVDIYMPLSAAVNCKVGDKVIAGESLLATLS